MWLSKSKGKVRTRVYQENREWTCSKERRSLLRDWWVGTRDAGGVRDEYPELNNVGPSRTPFGPERGFSLMGTVPGSVWKRVSLKVVPRHRGRPPRRTSCGPRGEWKVCIRVSTTKGFETKGPGGGWEGTDLLPKLPEWTSLSLSGGPRRGRSRSLLSLAVPPPPLPPH